MMIGSQKITISPSNKITLTVFTNNKYRIVGEQPSNLKGWQYVYESDKGKGEWVSPAADNDGIGIRAVMYTKSARIPVYRLATDDETAKINAALADCSTTICTDPAFPGEKIIPLDHTSVDWLSESDSGSYIIKDGSRYYLAGDPYTDGMGKLATHNNAYKDDTVNTPLDYVNNPSYYGTLPDVKMPTIRNAGTINDAISTFTNDDNTIRKTNDTRALDAAIKEEINISDSGKNVAVRSADDYYSEKSITLKNMSTTKSHTLREDDGTTVTLQPGETKVISCDNDLTASDDTGFTLSISAAGR